MEDVGPTLYKCYTNVLCLLDKYRKQEGTVKPKTDSSVPNTNLVTCRCWESRRHVTHIDYVAQPEIYGP